MSDSPTDITNLEARVKAMRALGVVKWADIELGPDPHSNAGGDDDEPQRLTAAEVEQRSRAERRRVAQASSGGPLKRVEQL